MNDNSLMCILDFLDIIDLVNVAQLSPRYMEIIRERYILSKYRLHEVDIHIHLWGDNNTRVYYYFPHSPSSGNLIALGLDDSLAILKSYGDLFSQLTIVFDEFYTQSHLEQFTNSIAKYCPAAIQSARVYFRVETNVITVPFPNVTKVFFRSPFDRSNSGRVYNIDLNHVFPQLQRVHGSYIDNLPLDRHYPHLIRFEMNGNYENRRKDLNNFIQLNP